MSWVRRTGSPERRSLRWSELARVGKRRAYTKGSQPDIEICVKSGTHPVCLVNVHEDPTRRIRLVCEGEHKVPFVADLAVIDASKLSRL